MAMHPPSGAQDRTFRLTDAVDVPVLVRTDSDLRRPHESRWRHASLPWPAQGRLPSQGDYLVTTTWRQILQAATSVGRDLAPWLRHTPSLAVNELIARVSPLQAYLQLKSCPGPQRACGRRLFVSPVYQHGTERSAQAAFGYHLGMAMAQWLTVGHSGLPSTVHLEACGIPALMNPHAKLPDLWGEHPGEGIPWLVEAKCRKHLGTAHLRPGMEQLDGGSAAVPTRHRQVLCGTSLPRADQWQDTHLFMTVHTQVCDEPLGGPASPSLPPRATPGASATPVGNPESVLRVTRDQLLIYRALAFGAVDDLRITLVGQRRAASPVAGRLHPAEVDPERQSLRTRFYREPIPDRGEGLEALRERGLDDFIAARVPGIGLHVGMSRRLFSACAALHQLQASLDDIPVPPTASQEGYYRDEDTAGEERSREERRSYYECEEEQLPEIRHQVSEAFAGGDLTAWGDLLGARPVRRTLSERDQALLLEATTTDTYLAIERTDPVLATQPR